MAAGIVDLLHAAHYGRCRKERLRNLVYVCMGAFCMGVFIMCRNNRCCSMCELGKSRMGRNFFYKSGPAASNINAYMMILPVLPVSPTSPESDA